MPRGLTTGQKAALAAPVVRMGLLAELHFKTSTQYIWSGIGELSYGGHLYIGVGTLGKIAPITETNTVQAQGLSITLTGIDPANLDVPDVLANMSVNNTAILSIVLLNAAGAVIDGPITSYSGFMDQAQIDESAAESTVTIALENKLAQLNRPRGWFLCDSDVRFWNPTEGAFQWTSYLQDYTFRFGN